MVVDTMPKSRDVHILFEVCEFRVENYVLCELSVVLQHGQLFVCGSHPDPPPPVPYAPTQSSLAVLYELIDIAFYYKIST